MKISKQPSGELSMSLSPTERKIVKAARGGELTTFDAENWFITEFLMPRGYKAERPENVCALTSAPLITDGVDVWGFMDYQITSFLQDLADGKAILWQKG